jgi:preprotein translocase subunit SecG
MKTMLFVIEAISAIGLIVTILMHSVKGEGMAGIGGQARLFSSQKGMETGLNRLTAVLAAVFLVTALLIGMLP